jgi:hypothetical protein
LKKELGDMELFAIASLTVDGTKWQQAMKQKWTYCFDRTL